LKDFVKQQKKRKRKVEQFVKMKRKYGLNWRDETYILWTSIWIVYLSKVAIRMKFESSYFSCGITFHVFIIQDEWFRLTYFVVVALNQKKNKLFFFNEKT
jgi:hypothetical protein